LQQKPGGPELAFELKRIRRTATTLLAKINETFPDYTVHDIRHSDTVVNILNWLIPLNLKREFNEFEIFFLLAAAYLHDVGMVNLPELFDETYFKRFLKEETTQINRDDQIREYIRKNHHLRAEKFINGRWKELQIDDIAKALIIGRLCRGHRGNLGDESLYNCRQMYSSFSKPINIPLLAAILQIADELDLTYERSPVLIYETFKPKTPISRAEWDKHLSINGVGIDPSNPLRIIVSAHCNDQDVHRALKKLEIKIQNMLDQLLNHLHQHSLHINEIPQRISVIIECEGYEAWDLKFSLQEKEIINLLMGERIYDRKEACLRELLQNSLDACRMRKAVLKKQGKDYSPEIFFCLSPEKDKIIVKDNGEGMNHNVLTNYLGKVGKSFYRSSDFIRQELDFSPISEFGIGLISCFMIAKKIEIDTKAENCEPYKVQIDSLEDYFLTRRGERTETGTTVTLWLKDEIRNQGIDLASIIRYYARHVDIPLRVACDSVASTIEDKEMDMNLGFFRDEKQRVSKRSDLRLGLDLAFHRISVKERDLRGVIAILFGKMGGFSLPLYPDWFSAYDYRKRKRVFVSRNGIFVNEIEDIITDDLPGLILADLDVGTEVLDLTVGRVGVIKNEKFEKLSNRILKIILEGVYQLFLQERSKNPQMFMERATDFLLYHLPRVHEYPDIIAPFYKEFLTVRCLTKEGYRFLNLDELQKVKRNVVVLFEAPIDDLALSFIRQCSDFTNNEIYVVNPFSIAAIRWSGVEPSKTERWLSRFKYDIIFDKGRLFPRAWKLARFSNYRTDRIFENFGTRQIFVNSEHSFIRKILEADSKGLLTKERRRTIYLFFREFRRRLHSSHGLKEILNEQREILEWLRDLHLIDKIDSFILTKDELISVWRRYF
jgi:hypothetical protein